MSRASILIRYDVVQGVIRSEGLFKGQQLYVPYFWEAYLNGNAHDVSDDLVLFSIHSEDLLEFPELTNRSVVRLRQRPDGKIEEA